MEETTLDFICYNCGEETEHKYRGQFAELSYFSCQKCKQIKSENELFNGMIIYNQIKNGYSR